MFVPIIGLLMSAVLAHRKKQKRATDERVRLQLQEIEKAGHADLATFLRDTGVRCGATIEHLRSMSAQLTEIRTARDVARAGTERHLALIRSTQARLNAVELELQSLRVDATELQAIISSEDRRMVALRDEDEDIKELMGKALSQIEHREKVVNELRAELSEKNVFLSESTAQVQHQDDRIGVLQGTVRSRDGEIHRLVGSLRGVVANRNRFQELVQQNDEHIDVLPRDIGNASATIATLTRHSEEGTDSVPPRDYTSLRTKYHCWVMSACSQPISPRRRIKSRRCRANMSDQHSNVDKLIWEEVDGTVGSSVALEVVVLK